MTILEASDRIASPWQARHPQLRLNIHRHFAQLPGLAMTRKDGTFVRRDTVVAYLEDYAARLDAQIAFGTRVERVERSGDGWLIRTDRGHHHCTDLVIATGRDRVPSIPIWPGLDTYGREVRHSADLGDISQYVGRNVLVIGAGNSGTDVLNHMARINPSKVWVSVRHGPAILPKRLLGFPLHRAAKLFAALPKPLLDPAFALVQWLAFGNLWRHGLRRHPDGGGTRMLRDGIAFALDDGFVAALKAGRIEAVAETVGYHVERVELADGRKIDPDVVICATGYQTGLEPLFGDLGVLDCNGHPWHPMGQPDPDNPGLWFTGFTPGFTGYFHAAGVTADRIAEAIARTRSSAGSQSAVLAPPNSGGRSSRHFASSTATSPLQRVARAIASTGAPQ